MTVSGLGTVSSARALSEPKYQVLNSDLADKLKCARQDLSKLIVDLKSPTLLDSQKSSLMDGAKQRLNTMSDNLALISAHKDAVADSNYKDKDFYDQTLNRASEGVRADYNALQTALDVSVGEKQVRFAPQE